MSTTDPWGAPNVEYARNNVEKPKADEIVEPKKTSEETPISDVEVVSHSVPEGTISEVLDWVGDDSGKAQAALDAEKDGKGRATLISKLEDILSN